MSGIRWAEGQIAYSRIPKWLLLADVSDRSIRLYALLSTYADNDSGRAFPSKEKLKKEMHCARSTLDEAFKDLVRAGALDIEEKFRRDGGQTSNDYVLHWTQARPAAPADSMSGSDQPEEAPLRSAGSPKELEPVVELEPEELQDSLRSSSGPPPIKLIDGQNIPLNTLLEVCHIDPANKQRLREATTALNGEKGQSNGITHYAWIEYDRWRGVVVLPRVEGVVLEVNSEAWSEILDKAIRLKASRYRTRLSGAVLTPLALRKWWLDLKPGDDDAVTGDDLRRG